MVTATFTNTTRGTLVINKVTNTTHGTLVINKVTIGGETGLFNFIISPPTRFESISVTGGSGSLIIPDLPTGLYTVIELTTGGLFQSVFIPAGGTGTLTFTNTAVQVTPGTLTVNKIALGGDGTFNFSIGPSAGGTAGFSITTVGGTGSVTLCNTWIIWYYRMSRTWLGYKFNYIG